MPTTEQTPTPPKAGTELAICAERPSAIIIALIQSKADPAYLREMLAVRQQWDADEARKAFNFAVAEFQRRAPVVEKADEANGKKYAALDRIWGRVSPTLTELGLSVTWQVCELRGSGADSICHLEGQLRHRDGHGERLVYDTPLPAIITNSQGKATQNAAQQMGSANTYAKRYALCAALGIVTGDDFRDDDGNGGAALVTDEQARQLSDLLDAARGVHGFNEKGFWEFAGVGHVSEIPAARYTEIMASLRRKIQRSS